MTRDHYDESFFFPFLFVLSFIDREQIAAFSGFSFLLFLHFSSSCRHLVHDSSVLRYFYPSALPLSLPLSLSLSLDVSLLLTSSRGRDSRLINAWNEILKERVLCLNIASIRRGVWLLFFTERSVQTCQRGCQREKKKNVI